MKIKKIISLLLSAILFSMTFPVFAVGDEAAREVEYLSRGGYGVAVDGGIYLSWRLLGTEPIEQTFDIYRNNELIVSDIDNLNYTDTNGTPEDIYKIVPHNGEALENDEFKPFSKAYKDILIDRPDGSTTPAGENYTYAVGGVSAADVDHDGEYEFIIQWDPNNAKDNETSGYTGNVYLDCYKQDGTKLWRIDMGINIRAGAHYTQFIVYDFDGNGKAEMAVRTAPGSKDSAGAYVSEKGAPIEGEELLWTDSHTGEVFTDESDLRGSAGGTEGKITKGPDWLTMFNGETGEAMQTVNYYPQRGNTSDWGDSYANRSERFLAGVAYLDGTHPSLIVSRGYYQRAAMAAYNWDGKNFSLCWTRNDTERNESLYGNGNHQISVCDADNDGKDEIVFGSTVVDDDGSILNSTDHGHGDALHVSDFDNDGEQEIFQVHEEAIGYRQYGGELRKAKDAAILAAVGADGDVGRGLMANFDDNIGNSEFFISADNNIYDMSGSAIGTKPNINPSFLVWWDGDLSRELLNRTSIIKYDIDSSKQTSHNFSQVISINKDAPALSADLFGDWREEVCYATEDNSTLRIFMTTEPTEYKIPTLMHDTQYRTAVAWQNVGYHQPPHTKYFVGSAALAENGRYLAPATGFDAVKMVGDAPVIATPKPTDTPAGKYTVNVKSVGSIRRNLQTYEDCEYMSSVLYTVPRYIVSNGTAYETDWVTTGTHYGGSVANVIKDQDIEIRYTKKYTNIVSFDDFDESANKSADVRASNGLARDNTAYTSEYKLQPGNSYTIMAFCCNTGRGSKFIADGKELFSVDSGNGAWQDYTITGVTVENESPVYTVAGSSGTYDPLDTILIIRETSQEETAVDLTSLDGTGLSIIGADEITSSAVVLPGVKRDQGTLTPAGYIEYTAPANGTLSFTFEASDTKNDGNYPRVYYSTSIETLNKNNAARMWQASGANAPLSVSIDVEKGKTYYLFGYIYNMTTDFTYTFSDFAIEQIPVSVAIGDIVFSDNSATVLVNVEDGSTDINVYTAVYDSTGRLKSVIKQSESVNGEKDFVTEFHVGSEDRVAVYIWDNNMTPYCGKQEK
ncbi:MAG: rhamnogalacturonan lyase [bacterium]|nr:rhamnogalacturonan lyase [bacterium]